MNFHSIYIEIQDQEKDPRTYIFKFVNQPSDSKINQGIP